MAHCCNCKVPVSDSEIRECEKADTLGLYCGQCLGKLLRPKLSISTTPNFKKSYHGEWAKEEGAGVESKN